MGTAGQPNSYMANMMGSPPRDIVSNPVPFRPVFISLDPKAGVDDRSRSAQVDPNRKGSLSPGKRNIYKPYGLKDYQDMKDQVPKDLGGLGSNVNTEDWYQKKQKMEKMALFAQNVKIFNA